jgi:tRNA dimethylallyltransferase
LKSAICNLQSAIVAVVGPTASGKSDLAVFLAERLGGEIVNYDSLQIYRGLDIGTAKSVPQAVPSHLFDILDPTETFSAGEYARQARDVLAQIKGLPVFVGGTGFYLRALLEGLFPGPRRNEELRERLQRRTSDRLHRLLHRLDAAAAARIHANDKAKLIRALEVCLQARRPMSEMWTEGRPRLEGYRVFKIGLNPPRSELYERINARVVCMFDGGLLDEVRALLDHGVPENAKPFESVGYAEAVAVVRGRMSREHAIESTQTRTRHYAKRQLTWFRREPDVRWLTGFGDDPNVQQKALAMLS